MGQISVSRASAKLSWFSVWRFAVTVQVATQAFGYLLGNRSNPWKTHFKYPHPTLLLKQDCELFCKWDPSVAGVFSEYMRIKQMYGSKTGIGLRNWRWFGWCLSSWPNSPKSPLVTLTWHCTSLNSQLLDHKMDNFSKFLQGPLQLDHFIKNCNMHSTVSEGKTYHLKEVEICPES